MSIDVFLCSCALPEDRIRLGLYAAVRARWELEPDTRLHVVTPEVIGCRRKHFQGLRRLYIESEAVSPVYVMAEDDCMPLGRDFIKRGVETLNGNKDFSVLSPLLLPFPPVPMGYQTPDVFEGITAGGINFTRKGDLKDMSVPVNEVFDESGQAEYVRSIGYRSGWMFHVKQNHLGACLSTIWPDDYRSGQTQVNES
jgi:hypothetical protein